MLRALLLLKSSSACPRMRQEEGSTRATSSLARFGLHGIRRSLVVFRSFHFLPRPFHFRQHFRHRHAEFSKHFQRHLERLFLQSMIPISRQRHQHGRAEHALRLGGGDGHVDAPRARESARAASSSVVVVLAFFERRRRRRHVMRRWCEKKCDIFLRPFFSR